MLNLFFASEAIGGYRFVIAGFIPYLSTSFTTMEFKYCIHHFVMK